MTRGVVNREKQEADNLLHGVKSIQPDWATWPFAGPTCFAGRFAGRLSRRVTGLTSSWPLADAIWPDI